MGNTNSNVWLNNSLSKDVLKKIENVNQIPNLKFLVTNYDYVLYHIYLMEVTTLDQLVSVTQLTIREVRNAMKKINSKTYIESIPFTFNGKNINFIFITNEGLDRVLTIFEIVEFKRVKKVTNKDLKHFVEVNTLHVNLFRDVKTIAMNKEQNLRVNRYENVRSDAIYEMEYTSGCTEKVVLEHDRGTERVKKLENKLLQYAIAMRVNDLSNVSFSVSKETLMTKSICDSLQNISEFDHIKFLGQLKVVVNNISNDFNCVTLLDLLNLKNRLREFLNSEDVNEVEKYRKGELNSYLAKLTRYLELINNIKSVKELVKDGSEKISKVQQLFNDDIEKKKRDRLRKVINEYLLDNESERCNLIKSLINDQDDYIEISREQIRKFDGEDYKKVFEEGMYTEIQSFKSLLLTHECFILPMQQMITYYKWKVVFHRDLNRSIVNYFGLKEKEYDVISHPIKLYAGSKIIIKRENSFVIQGSNGTFGFIILNTEQVFSDELKMKSIKDNLNQVYSELEVVYLVDIADCKWHPSMQGNLFDIHKEWLNRIISISSKQ